MRNSKTAMKKNLLLSLLFLLIFAGLFHLTNVTLFEKQHFGTAKNIAHEEPGKIDVFFIGASHIFYGINPAEIWESTGIAGYNLTTHQQPLWSSKLLLQHALKKQQPKLIVLDVLMATNFSRPLLGTEQGTNMTHLALDPVPLSLEKIRGVLKTDSITEKGEILFPIILSHSRLQQGLLSWDDFHFYGGRRGHVTKGYNFTTNNLSYEKPEVVPEDTHELPEGLEETLIDFIRFCREENLPLLLIKTPMYGTEELYQQMNHIGEIAARYDVPYLDFNHLYEEIDMDFASDLADSGHLNVYGAQKVSRYLAQYLTAHYPLPDHRGDPAYADWERAADHYESLLHLKDAEEILPHLRAAKDPDLMTVIMAGGALPESETIPLPEAVTEAFAELGLSADAPQAIGQGAYYAVLNGGELLGEGFSTNKVRDFDFSIRDSHFSLTVSAREPDGGSYMTALHIGKGGYSSLEPGLLLVTYDTDRMEVVDAVKYAFDATLSLSRDF